jgi:hypothetical protein
MEPTERLETATTAMVSDLKAQILAKPSETTTRTVADVGTVETVIRDWPALAKKVAHLTIRQYGPPNEAIPSSLIWYNNGPWKRTVVSREEIPHDFPAPHTDVIEQAISYRVPPEKLSELAKFDGSITVYRTRGEVSSSCDMEAANFIALNLMHDIVEGKLSAEQARRAVGEIMTAYLLNRPTPYAERLQFEVSAVDTGETDEVEIAEAVMHQAIGKVQDLLGPEQRTQV